MKNNLLKIFMLGAIIAFVIPACTNLEEDVFSEFTDANFPTNEDQFISALGVTYTSLYGWAGHNSLFSLQEVSSDEIHIPHRGADWEDGRQWIRVHQHAYNADEQSVNNGWNFAFTGVSNCNRVIALFEGLVADGKTDPDQAAAFIAEVKVLRGLFYYWLLDGYGNVPIVKSFADADPNPATASRAEVYAFIKEDLEANVPNLSRTVDQSTYARATYYMGQALLAKLSLNSEVYTGSADWQGVVDACNNIIDGGAYSLEGNYFANFNEENSGSAENIFVIPYDENQAQGFNIPAQTLHYSSQETFNLTFQPWNGYCAVQEFYESYEDGDLRKGESGNQKVRSNFHAGPQFAADGATPIVDATADDPGGAEIVFTPELNALAPNCYREAGARVGKYEYANGATNNLNNDFPVFRYADVLLMKAEAMWRMDNGSMEALDLVNEVRTRAGAEAYTALTAENLLAERGREFFYEGWRRQDLIRFDAYEGDWSWRCQDNTDAPMECNDDPNLRIFPIPTQQLSANPNLVQNPGY